MGDVWITRYVERARDRLLLDAKERALFVTSAGEPIHPDTLTGYARRYIEAAGIDKPGACPRGTKTSTHHSRAIDRVDLLSGEP